MRVNPLRSVGARLSLALLLVVAGSLALVYVVVIPSLESRLIDSKISQLKQAVPNLLRYVYPDDPPNSGLFASDAADQVSARVVVYSIFSTTPLALAIREDSQGLKSSSDVENDPIALKLATSTKSLDQGTVDRSGTRYAEVAFLLPDGNIALITSSLEDTLGAVSVARQRLLIAGGIVLVLSLLVGYVAAWLFARRIRRLEQAAERIASGEFDEPIVDRGQDEIGELARAFDRMRERLSQLDRARREFIANASHELRTPLFTLGGFLELLDDEDLDEPTREEFLTTMRDQVKRLSKLASELLDLSRLDAGHIDLEREPVSLAATARLVADDFAAVSRRSGRVLRVDADESALAVGDEQRIVQILGNLVENAIMHTPPGTQVRIRAVRLPNGAVISVEDDGPGIPAEQADHVFERFYRGDGSQASGSGLGLAIAQELAEAMGGALELESRPGRTVFSLVLPTAGPEPLRVPREPAPLEA